MDTAAEGRDAVASAADALSVGERLAERREEAGDAGQRPLTPVDFHVLVRDVTGAPVEGVAVSHARRGQVLVEEETDKDGLAHLSGPMDVRSGRLALELAVTGYTRTLRRIELPDPGVPVELSVPCVRPLRVEFVGADGAPLEVERGGISLVPLEGESHRARLAKQTSIEFARVAFAEGTAVEVESRRGAFRTERRLLPARPSEGPQTIRVVLEPPPLLEVPLLSVLPLEDVEVEGTLEGEGRTGRLDDVELEVQPGGALLRFDLPRQHVGRTSGEGRLLLDVRARGGGVDRHLYGDAYVAFPIPERVRTLAPVQLSEQRVTAEVEVVDSTGAPLPDARVDVRHRVSKDGGTRWRAFSGGRLKADADGLVRLLEPSPHELRAGEQLVAQALVVRAPDFMRLELTAHPGERLQVTLKRSVLVSVVLEGFEVATHGLWARLVDPQSDESLRRPVEVPRRGPKRLGRMAEGEALQLELGGWGVVEVLLIGGSRGGPDTAFDRRYRPLVVVDPVAVRDPEGKGRVELRIPVSNWLEATPVVVTDLIGEPVERIRWAPFGTEGPPLEFTSEAVDGRHVLLHPPGAFESGAIDGVPVRRLDVQSEPTGPRRVTLR